MNSCGGDNENYQYDTMLEMDFQNFVPTWYWVLRRQQMRFSFTEKERNQ